MRRMRWSEALMAVLLVTVIALAGHGLASVAAPVQTSAQNSAQERAIAAEERQARALEDIATELRRMRQDARRR